MPLPEAPAKGLCRVLEICGESEDLSRLKALGICVDRKVQLVQAGDPLIVRVLGTRVGISKRLAEVVLVQPI